MEEDISSKTVLVLLVLTIIISVVGTLMVLEEASKIKISTGQSTQTETQQSQSSNQVGLVKLTIQERPVELQRG